MRIADIKKQNAELKKQNAELKKQNAELKKELELAHDQLKAFERLIAHKNARINEIAKQNSELSTAILSQSMELKNAYKKLEKRAGFFSRLW